MGVEPGQERPARGGAVVGGGVVAFEADGARRAARRGWASPPRATRRRASTRACAADRRRSPGCSAPASGRVRPRHGAPEPSASPPAAISPCLRKVRRSLAPESWVGSRGHLLLTPNNAHRRMVRWVKIFKDLDGGPTCTPEPKRFRPAPRHDADGGGWRLKVRGWMAACRGINSRRGDVDGLGR